ncbi:MAG TPA: GNAT family N-acetyltransferase [Stackebrandtia sp.]|jgi:predicted GNAT family acetyltransferase|uniref:GNAT family N-acetyltransferase n=1 Tax=Stackebrandtia sp. TaxID=2023065 RepID=UPI002D27BF0C|nr:GNAT family N-acetyltransferase [Stackebrandtia sp.]HZE40532.1 GNAT family N-acetyltransferase [Stackebrandtia sp.]
MRCEIDTDVDAFYREVAPWLGGDPIANTVACTVIAQRTEGVMDAKGDDLWIRLVDDEGVCGVSFQTPPHGLYVTAISDAALEALVGAVEDARPQLTAVNGPAATVERFVALWSVRTGCAARAGMATRLFSIDEVRHPQGVEGRRRAVGAEDRGVVIDWLDRFSLEAEGGHAQGPAELAKSFDRRLAKSQPQWLWEVDGEPVSMTLESLNVAGVVRVQGVYTPREQRGRGYASALVAEVSAEILSRPEVSGCVLFTDLANPTSNGVYRRIGYRPVGDHINYVFSYTSPTTR